MTKDETLKMALDFLMTRRMGAEAVIEALNKALAQPHLPVQPEPAQRPWVGLTEEDRREFAAAQYGWEDLLIAAEAKLKERNT